MREILFKAKRIDNGEWVEGYYLFSGRTEPFCYSMPLTKEYIERCEMEIVDNPELLQEVPE